MATNDATTPTEKGVTTDAQPTTIPERPHCIPEGATWLGRDDAGREHYATGPLPRGTVLVTDGDAIAERLELPVQETDSGTVIRTRPDWMAYVAERCGWDVRADESSLVDDLAAGLGGSA